jgi:hypothetical protein
VSDTVSPDKAAGQQAVPAMAGHRSGRLLWPVTALAAFAVLCVVVLSVAPALLEVDDFAYRASIVAMTDGHFLTLSTAQTHALEAQLAGSGRGPRIAGPGGSPPSIAQWQWVQLPGGRWISEKDPGYPFLAAPFQALGIIRLAPLFYGALGCLGLFFGARRWLGPCGGAAAVGLFCSSGAALAYAWREYMPTFTEASLIAAGTGAVLWAMLAEEAAARRRTGIGLLGFLAIEAAVFVRYTDIVVLGCAVVAVLAARRLHAASTPPSALRWWLGSVALFGTGVALFDDGVYGGPLKSAYPSGEIVFSLSAIIPNLRSMPAHLLQAIPALVLALAGMAWITVRWVRLRRTGGEEHATSRRDFAVALALTLSWFSLWGLYAAYAWTTQPGLGTVQTARFYVPAMGAIALLGAWAVARLPLRVSLVAAALAAAALALFGLGVWSYTDMVHPPDRGSPAPHCNIGEPHCPARPPDASRLSPSPGEGREAAVARALSG